ncbi:PucR family transcriptional regulator [Mycetocola tolaasinivorans]|uniref:PucR family transcriptional regulator n=1 Tax=Mycetocola tolaasinivorans TaxID=76635 RepID=A0A3L7ADJ3_9MICO|nr:helix-turn-helix domain-containing protein [Mycetocola tolaasinivorans]RLP77452.1 PucR family transcriptional regulator [Mycetocola tolaasinivorans]
MALTEDVELRTLLSTIGSPLARLLTAGGGSVPVRTSAVIEAEELRSRSLPEADVLLLIGVRIEGLVELLALVPAGSVLFVKLASENLDAIATAQQRRVHLVRVHPDAGWDQLAGIVQRVLARTAPLDTGRGDDAEDLFTLAESVAAQVRGLVSIEGPGGEVLAYSRAVAGADELRISSILGRRGPAAQMRRLSDEGVLTALAREDTVLYVPATADGLRQERLAVGIHDAGEFLGTLWVQRGPTDFAPDARELLPGAARIAVRGLRGRPGGPGQEERLVRGGLGLGAHGVEPSVTDRYALASMLDPHPGEFLAVIGFAAESAGGLGDQDAAALTGYLRLSASSHRRRIVVGTHRGRLYAVVTGTDPDRLTEWTENAVSSLRARLTAELRAGIAEAEGGLPTLAEARLSVDHLLDTVARDPARFPTVVTRSGLRSDVLLGEVTGWLAARPDLRDPRLTALRAHDAEHDGSLVPSVRVYLDAFSDVRHAAERLGIHPNTLRYRLTRAQQISGLDLADAATRLMLALLLRLPEPTGSGATE